jgi:uncharacterized membrane-anchored protein
VKNINLKKLKDLYARYSIVKKAYKTEADFKIKEGLKTTLIDLIAKIESEVGAPLCTADKDLFF